MFYLSNNAEIFQLRWPGRSRPASSPSQRPSVKHLSGFRPWNSWRRCGNPGCSCADCSLSRWGTHVWNMSGTNYLWKKGWDMLRVYQHVFLPLVFWIACWLQLLLYSTLVIFVASEHWTLPSLGLLPLSRYHTCRWMRWCRTPCWLHWVQNGSWQWTSCKDTRGKRALSATIQLPCCLCQVRRCKSWIATVTLQSSAHPRHLRGGRPGISSACKMTCPLPPSKPPTQLWAAPNGRQPWRS